MNHSSFRLHSRANRAGVDASAAVGRSVALLTNGDEVVLFVAAAVASKNLMVHMQVLHRATMLTPPAVTLHDPLAQRSILLWIQAQWPHLERHRMTSSLCSPGSSLT